MKVTVKLFADLRKGRFEEKVFDIDNSADVDYLMNMIGVKHDDTAIVLINGRHAEWNTVISDGDTVAIFPPTGGG